jgi:hypothetical protein
MHPKTPSRKRAMKILHGAIAVALALSVAAGSAAADERDHRRGAERGRHEGWRGQSHRFNEHDLGRWRAGHWYHGRHSGRLGWWWIVGGIWYFYPAAVYPYPDPYLPPGVFAQAVPAPGNAPLYWYYCAKPAGYYPTVPVCRLAWQRVPARVPAGVAR